MIRGDDLPPAVHLILCEGPEDRAFWNGLLNARGWDQVKEKSGRIRVVRRRSGRTNTRSDAANAGGDRRPYTLGTREPSDKDPDPPPRPYVEVHPAGGFGNLLKTLRSLLEEDRADAVIGRVLLNFDTDLSDKDVLAGKTGLTADGVRTSLTGANWDAEIAEGGSVRIADRETAIALVPWTSDVPRRDGVPEKRTLERIVCEAITAVYPERGEAVEAWLRSRPGVDPADEPHRHKSSALSYYAGWSPSGGSFAFYEALWRDRPVAVELQRLLIATGVWAAVGRLLGEGPE